MSAVSPAIFTETVSVPALIPEEGVTVSQLPPKEVLGVAVQLSVPAPELEMLTVWLAGLAPPCDAVKVSEVALSAILGGAAVMTSVTVMICEGTSRIYVPTWMVPV